MGKKYKKNVVVIGGGTGTHTLLTGLKRYARKIALKAIVTMADSGGSTGRLRDEFGYLPVGDVRMALTALARDSRNGEQNILRDLFMYRFDRGNGLSGHSLGNLFLIALTDLLGSEVEAIRLASKVLAICGDVIPVTEESIDLHAQYDDGSIVTFQHNIDSGILVQNDSTITRLSLQNPAKANPYAIEAIHNASVVVLGPGDFYTSILANCVVEGIPEALQNTQAKIIYIANLMSRNGQTNGMGTREYIKTIQEYTGRQPDYMIVNTAPLREDLLKKYHEDGEHEVVHTYADEEVSVIAGDFAAQDDVVRAKGDVLKRSLIRHNPHALARAIMDLV